MTRRRPVLLVWLIGAGVVALVANWIAASLSAQVQPDVAEYQAYAAAFWQHHQLPLEYPPMAILAIALPVSRPDSAYALLFGAWMGCFAVTAYFLVRWAGGAWAGVAFLGYLVAGAFATVLQRFDIVPATLVLAAYLALRERRHNATYMLLAIGTLIKLFPAFLVPLVVIDQYRSTRQAGSGEEVKAIGFGLGLFLAIVMGGFGLAFLVDSSHAIGPFRYAFSRPLEVESGPATLLWLTSFVGQPVHGAFSYGSFNLLGGGEADRWLGAIGGLVLVVGWTLAGAGLWRGRIEVGRAWIATLCVVLLSGKVLSAQYLIWLMPLIALVDGLDLVWLLVALSTTLVFPILFDHVTVQAGGILVYPGLLLATIAARNGLLLFATLRELDWLGWERLRAHRYLGLGPAATERPALRGPRPIESSPVPR
ncbi:MAG: hypothetical protein ACHQ0J_04530 [Candidatus Dormibacterales bacterium]